MSYMKENYKIFRYIPKPIRIITLILSLVWMPFMAIVIIKNDLKNEFIILSIISTILVILMYHFSNRLKMLIYEDKVESYGFFKKVFKNELIESIKLDDFGTILLKYDGKIYKIRGVVSLLFMDSSTKKNQEIVDIINKNIGKECSPDALLDDISSDNDINLF